jgi:hypothetical protein
VVLKSKQGTTKKINNKTLKIIILKVGIESNVN